MKSPARWPRGSRFKEPEKFTPDQKQKSVLNMKKIIRCRSAVYGSNP
jgi:hypothetical protein